MAQLAAVAVMAAGEIYKSGEAQKNKEEEARNISAAARRRMAVTSREIGEESRNNEFMYSRALAVAAMSGAGTADQGMVALFGDLRAEGEYRILSRLYAGQNEAEGLAYQAEMAHRESKASRDAGYVGAISSLVSGAGQSGAFGSKGATTPTYNAANVLKPIQAPNRRYGTAKVGPIR